MKTNYQRLLSLALTSAVLTAGLLYAMVTKVNISIKDACVLTVPDAQFQFVPFSYSGKIKHTVL
jgi:hypothetical protein